MAAPIDPALYRMKAYAGLLLAGVDHEKKDIGHDIKALVDWIEHARPLLGAVSPAVSPDPVDDHFGQPHYGHAMEETEPLIASKPPRSMAAEADLANRATKTDEEPKTVA